MTLVVNVFEFPVKSKHVLVGAANLFIGALARLSILVIRYIDLALFNARSLFFFGGIFRFFALKFCLLGLSFKWCNTYLTKKLNVVKARTFGRRGLTLCYGRARNSLVRVRIVGRIFHTLPDRTRCWLHVVSVSTGAFYRVFTSVFNV